MSTWETRSNAEDEIRAGLGGVSEGFDFDGFLAEVLEYDGQRFRIAEAYQDDDVWWALVQRMDAAGDQEAARLVVARDAEGERLAEALRQSARSWVAADWGRMRLRPNGEFREGGMRRWPTAESWWVEITAPDGEVERVGADAGSWVGLLDATEEAERDWAMRAEKSRASAERAVERAATLWQAARDAERQAREARDEAVRAGLAAGLTTFRMAQLTGVSRQGLDRIAGGKA